MNLFFVNLEGVRVLSVNDEAEIPEVHVELVREIVGCPTCGVVAIVKDQRRVTLVDLTMAGRMVVLVWNKRRFRCVELDCSQGTWTEVEPRVAAPRLEMTDPERTIGARLTNYEIWFLAIGIVDSRNISRSVADYSFRVGHFHYV